MSPVGRGDSWGRAFEDETFEDGYLRTWNLRIGTWGRALEDGIFEDGTFEDGCYLGPKKHIPPLFLKCSVLKCPILKCLILKCLSSTVVTPFCQYANVIDSLSICWRNVDMTYLRPLIWNSLSVTVLLCCSINNERFILTSDLYGNLTIRGFLFRESLPSVEKKCKSASLALPRNSSQNSFTMWV